MPAVQGAAEVVPQLPPDLLRPLQLPGRQGGRVAHRGGVLRHLLGGVHARQHHGHVGVGGGEAQRQGRVLNGPAGQALHVDEPNPLGAGPLHQLRALALHNVVGEHDRLHPVQLQRPCEGVHGVGGKAQMADLPRRLGLQQGLQGSAGGAHLLQLLEIGVVDLVEVNKVRAEVAQAHLDILSHALPVPGHGLGGQHEPVPPALDGLTNQLLADRVAPGGVDEVDPRGLHRVQQRPGLAGVQPLDGDAPEAHAGHPQAGPAQNHIFHIILPPYLLRRGPALPVTALSAPPEPPAGDRPPPRRRPPGGPWPPWAWGWPR